MKKLFWIFVIIAITVAVFAYRDEDFRQMILQATGQTPAKSVVYKWRNNKGEWQISNKPPAKGIPYTEQEYLDNTNVIPSLPEKK
ncbi:MAG: hypothetical protein GXP13_09060 [Gammaproteobacteria bacterium]|nr:hypothetical protein [Gammaproteobacteria bacterium]